MALLAYNLTGSPVALVYPVVNTPVLSASDSPPNPGAGFDVTSELRGLEDASYDALEAQRPSTILYQWSGAPEYYVGSLTIGNAISSAGGQVIVWSPSNPTPGDNVYTTFGAALAARSQIRGTVTIEIDDYYDTPVIDPGVYDLDDTILTGRHTFYWFQTRCDLSEGVVFLNARDFRNLNINLNNDTTPVISLTSIVDTLRLYNTIIWNEEGGAFYNLVDSLIIMQMSGGSRFNNDDGPSIIGDNTSAAYVCLDDQGTGFDYDQFDGDMGVFVSMDSECDVAEQPGVGSISISLQSDAAQTNYEVGDFSDWSVGPSTVADALDKLAARPIVSHETFLLPDAVDTTYGGINGDQDDTVPGLQPSHPTNCTVTFDDGWDGGDIHIFGNAIDGTVVSDTITTSVRVGSVIFNIITSITNTNPGGSSGKTATVKAGAALGVASQLGTTIVSFNKLTQTLSTSAFDSFLATDASHGSFTPTTPKDGTHSYEVWYVKKSF